MASKAILGAIIVAGVGAAKVTSESPATVGYTKDPFCIEKNCVNPLVPGLEEFGANVFSEYEKKSWTCLEGRLTNENAATAAVLLRANLSQEAGFCQKVVADYAYAVPVAEESTIEEVMLEAKVQQKRAVNAYVAHLTAIGRDLWHHQKPWEHDECIQAVWKMSCYTHFPRCNEVEKDQYLRPCASGCESFLRQCDVSCCDEGTHCIFNHHKKLADGTEVVDTGYANHKGPSSLCTGS